MSGSENRPLSENNRAWFCSKSYLYFNYLWGTLVDTHIRYLRNSQVDKTHKRHFN